MFLVCSGTHFFSFFTTSPEMEYQYIYGLEGLWCWILSLTSQVFSSWQLKNLPSPTFSSKSLHLQLDLVKWHLLGILNLLKHCPCLKNLIIKITSYESTFHGQFGNILVSDTGIDSRSVVGETLVVVAFYCFPSTFEQCDEHLKMLIPLLSQLRCIQVSLPVFLFFLCCWMVVIWRLFGEMSMSAKQRSCVFNKDHFSGLPDAILIHILSLLPSKAVVNTMLIRRFHHLWPFIHTLNFDQCMFPGHICSCYARASRPNYDEKYVNFVRHVLLLHKGPTIHKFCLKFHFRSFYEFWQRTSSRTDIWQYDFLRSEKRMANEIGTWIQFALNKNLEVLDLSFYEHGTDQPQAFYDLPNCVLSCPHLVELRLTYCKINSKRKSELKSLKTLYLDNVMLIDQSMDSILSGCPMLEELTLQLCYSDRRVVLLNSTLKTLKLDIRWFQPRIHVSCPTLLSLDMSGAVEVLDIANVASIAEVSVKRNLIFDFNENNDYQNLRIFLQTFSGAKTLKLCSWLALAFSVWQLNNLPSPTFSCKSLHLQLDFVIWHLPGILNFLKHCPCLENLTIEITSYDGFAPHNALSWIHLYEFDAGEYRNMVDDPVQCLIDHLKTVEVAGLVMEKQVIQFLVYLLGHSMVLQKMKIFAKKKTSDKAHETSNPNSLTFDKAHETSDPNSLTSDKAHETSDPNSLTSDKAHEYEERLLNAPKASASAAVFFY